MNNIFISSSCGYETVESIINNSVDKIGLEFGFSLSAEDTDSMVALAKKKEIPLLAHNYFRPQKGEFVFNLSDPDFENRKASLDYAVAMVDYCAQNHISSYSIHSGFACSFSEKHFGQPLSSLPSSSLQTAYDLFIHNLRLLADYAAKKKVNLLFENNVLTKENISDGQNQYLLCVTAEDILYIFSLLGNENVQLLLDLGHLNVSCSTLGLSPIEEFYKIAYLIGQIHVHDNDGKSDQHNPVGPVSWFWELLLLKNIPLIIEQPKAEIDIIMSQIMLLRELRSSHVM